VDLAGVREMVKVLPDCGVRDVVYVSLAQPAPTMHAYIRVRQECERMIARTGVEATVPRPWYVLGPGRRWLLPTPAGQAKVDRNVGMGIRLFLGQLP
jgi:uncharacterized protein YbjT (DUF2867 family)